MAVAFLIFWVLDKSIEISHTVESVALGFLLTGSALGAAGWFCLNHTEYLMFTLTYATPIALFVARLSKVYYVV